MKKHLYFFLFVLLLSCTSRNENEKVLNDIYTSNLIAIEELEQINDIKAHIVIQQFVRLRYFKEHKYLMNQLNSVYNNLFSVSNYLKSDKKEKKILSHKRRKPITLKTEKEKLLQELEKLSIIYDTSVILKDFKGFSKAKAEIENILSKIQNEDRIKDKILCQTTYKKILIQNAATNMYIYDCLPRERNIYEDMIKEPVITMDKLVYNNNEKVKANLRYAACFPIRQDMKVEIEDAKLNLDNGRLYFDILAQEPGINTKDYKIDIINKKTGETETYKGYIKYYVY
jgi:hypothetical protein